MKAKKKKIDKVTPKDLGVDISPKIEVTHFLSNLLFKHFKAVSLISPE
jgi:hypothetical protein